MKDWIRAYDQAEVNGTAPDSALWLASDAMLMVTSSLPRALSSARALRRDADVVDSVYREAPLPYADGTALRLPPAVWAGVFRVLWLAGYSRHADSVATTTVPAKEAAERLAGWAADQKSVLLVGHGIMNRMIGRELRRLGWVRADADAGSGYWSAVTYWFGGADSSRGVDACPSTC